MPGDLGVTVVDELVWFFTFPREAADVANVRHSPRPDGRVTTWADRVAGVRTLGLMLRDGAARLLTTRVRDGGPHPEERPRGRVSKDGPQERDQSIPLMISGTFVAGGVLRLR